jgi:predicted secreted protein
MSKFAKIMCALLIVGAMIIPASAQIVLSVHKGSTFPITLVENPSVGKWTLSTTSGLQIVSNTYSHGLRTITVKSTKYGYQTVNGRYTGKSGKTLDKLSKTVNVI